MSLTHNYLKRLSSLVRTLIVKLDFKVKLTIVSLPRYRRDESKRMEVGGVSDF